MTGSHLIKTRQNKIDIKGQPEKIWDNITKVKIGQFSNPFIFKDYFNYYRSEIFV